MGYDTCYAGEFLITPALTTDELEALHEDIVMAEQDPEEPLGSDWCCWHVLPDSIQPLHLVMRHDRPASNLRWLLAHPVLAQHSIEGTVHGRGDRSDDMWEIIVDDNDMTCYRVEHRLVPMTKAEEDRNLL